MFIYYGKINKFMEESFKSNLNNDLPIYSLSDDKLGRKEFIIQVRNVIKYYGGKDSLTIGLMGPWGSGKTSLVNMIFEQEGENILTKNDFPVMRFNPWNFSQQNDLYFQFFEQLKEILVANENDESKRRYISTVVNKYWEKIRYNATISLSYPGFISYSKPLGEKTLESFKNEINKMLRFCRYKLIIVIDDIDRLTDDEIQQIFILIKALADFPNIIYILPFDRQVIVNSIDKLQEGRGDEFLDKIIQLQIDLPKISYNKVKNIFKDDFENLIKSMNLNLDSRRNTWAMLSFLSSIRDINRYINNLKFYLPLMKYEVDYLDYILITGLQLFENDVYHEIKNNKLFFTRDLLKKPNTDMLEQYKEYFSKILSKRNKLSEEKLIEILKELFPQLFNFEMNWDLANQVPEWVSQLRICSYDMFDRYFELNIGETEMANIIFDRIINSVIKKEVLKNDEEGKSENFLEILKYNTKKIKKNNIKFFFRLLYDVGDNLNVETGDFIFSKNTLLLQNIRSLSSQLNDLELYDAMLYAIKNAEDALYLFVDDLAIHDQINKRYRFKNQENGGQKRLSDFQLDELEKEACEKIKIWAENGKIFDVNHAFKVIYEWYFWEEQEYLQFIEKTISDDEKLIQLLVISIKFISQENEKIKFEFYEDIMEDIYPIDKICLRIRSMMPILIEGSDEKLVCEYFLEQFEK